eukprot:5314432-Amphidinium_carterae.1
MKKRLAVQSRQVLFFFVAAAVLQHGARLRIKEAQVPMWEPGNPLPEAELEEIETCRCAQRL